MTKTFKGTTRNATTVFGGTVKVAKLSKDDNIKLRNFLADRFFRVQDKECLRLVMGTEFDSISGTRRLRGAFDPAKTGGSNMSVTTCERLLEMIHDPEGDRDWLGSGEVRRRRVQLMSSCCEWKELKQISLEQLTAAVYLYFESHQEVLLGRPVLHGPTAMVMKGVERTPMTPQLLLANAKRLDVETWRNKKRAEARKKLEAINAIGEEIIAENAVTDELIMSPKAWTRKGQQEIAAMKKATRVKEARKVEMEEELQVIVGEAEMVVKSVLEDMWNSSDEETKEDYIEEYHALCDKYIEPRVGQRVRLSGLQIRHVRQKGVLDKSLGPGSCDLMAKASTRWFGNMTFQDGNFADIPAGVLAHHGGVGTVNYVHDDRDRVMVQWDRTGKIEWYSTGFQSKFHIVLLDMDEGMGTTGFLEGLTTKRLLTNRIDMTPAEAATRAEIRRQHAQKMRSDLPNFGTEGDKHVGLEYDRLNGTGYL